MQRQYLPALQWLAVCGDGADETFRFAESRPVVDPAEILDEDVEVAVGGAGQRQRAVAVVAGEHTDAVLVEEDLGAVTHLVDVQHAGPVARR